MNAQSKHRTLSTITKRVLVVAILCGGVAFAAVAANQRKVVIPEQAVKSLRQSGQAFAAIAKTVSPAVVSIRVEKMAATGPANGLQFGDRSSPFNDDLLKRFFGDDFQKRQFRQQSGPNDNQPSQRRVVEGQGSGFIVASDGYILTNNHVAGDADKITVRLYDEREFDAKLIGSDSHTDVAVIKIDATSLPTLQLGDSDALQVGEWVLASGAPFGLTHTLTAGIVSAKGRSSVGIADYENFIQTDAAINPGNSGGPLVNLNGEVIGINTAIYSKSGGYMGVGFAIPVNLVKQVYQQIREHGSVTRAYLGVMIQKLTPALAKQFKVKDMHGVLVGDVKLGAPGEKAGLKSGDVIVNMDGKPVTDIGRFRNAIALKSPETQVDLTVIRNGKTMHMTVKLAQLPGQNELASSASSGTLKHWGFSVQSLTPEMAKQLNLSVESGVVISGVDSNSTAARAGLKAGMLIEQINRKPVTSLEDFKAALEQSKDSKSVLLLVNDGGNSRFIVVNSGK